jgi:hypothetical protein
MNYIAICLICVICIIIAYLLFNKKQEQERYSIKQEAGSIYKKTKTLFNSNPTYEKYRQLVPNGDIVDYSKLKTLSSKGQFTQANIKDNLT